MHLYRSVVIAATIVSSILPVDFITPLAALVDRPRVNLSCYHGLLSSIVFLI